MKTSENLKAQTEVLETASTAITNLNATEAGLLRLHEQYDDATFDVETKPGMKLAKEARAEIRKPRFNVEKLRKAAKAPLLELGRMIDADAKSLTTELLTLETPIDTVIKAEELRETKRVCGIKNLIDEIEGVLNVIERYNPSAEKIGEFINDVTAIEINAEAYMEFEADAIGKQQRVLQELRTRMAAKQTEEDDAAELAQLRREKAERDEADRKEEERKQAVADAAQKAVDDANSAAEETIEEAALRTHRETIAEATGEGSKGDAGSIFDEDNVGDHETLADAGDTAVTMPGEVPPPIEEQLMRKDPEPATPAYPGRKGIVYGVATYFDVTEAQAEAWLVTLIEDDALPF